MTFQDAETRFRTIVDAVTPASPPAVRAQTAQQLQDLAESLPNLAELDPVADAIAAATQALAGEITQEVAADLRARTAALGAAAALLGQTAAIAAADARTLTFDQPRLLAAGLAGCLTAARDLRTAVAAQDVPAMAAKAEALWAQLAQLEGTIKSE